MKIKAVIEIPEGSKEKIEIKNGIPKVDRLLNIECPAAYGFVPNTLAEDGDPLDIFVLSDKRLNTSDNVKVKVIGLFACIDNGIQDDKLIGVVADEDMTEIGMWKRTVAIGHYLMNYKTNFKIEGYGSLSSSQAKVIIKKYNKETGILSKLVNFFK